MIIQGRFINADQEIKGQIQIENGKITKIEEEIGKPDLKFTNSYLIFPGMIDLHAHAREDQTGKQNYKEDYQSVCRAALNGGVTGLAVMPNTPSPLISKKQLEWHQKKVKELPIPVMNYVGIGPGSKPLKEKVPYKVYTGPSIGELFFKDEKELRETLSNYKKMDISFHVEDFEILEKNRDKRTHAERRPPEAVEVALEYVLDIVETYEINAKLCHWPIGGNAIEMIRKHRKNGFETTIEVSPLHLYFDTQMLEETPEMWPLVQMNPSIQSRKDRLELIKLLRDGFIDYIATDHAPHTLDEKFKNFGGEKEYLRLKKEHLPECRTISCIDSVSGTPQLDTYALIAAWLIREKGFKPGRIAKCCSENPAKFMEKFRNEKYGKIEVGYSASLTIINISDSTTVKRETLQTKVKWSPFENITLPGKLKLVMVNGKIHYQNGGLMC